MKLRPYQQDGEHRVLYWLDRVRCVLLVIPTGGGKTVVFSKIVAEWQRGARCVVVHRREILGQISLALAQFGVKHKVIAPNNTVRSIRRRHLKKFGKSFVDDRNASEVAVASVQTLASPSSMKDPLTVRFCRSVGLAVFDEAHHYVNSGHWARAVDRFEHSRMLHVTASPERADGKGLGSHASGYADKMVQCYDEDGNLVDTRWLQDQGYLCKTRYFCPESDLDVSDVATGANGEFNAKALRERIVESHLVGDLVKQVQQFAQGKKVITFSDSVATAEEQARRYNEAGVPSVYLHGGSDEADRDREVERFASTNELLNLVNVSLFDEGFDVPGVDAVAMGAPTESLARYLQSVGRALRPVYADGYDLDTREGRLAAIANGPKPYAIIIDPVRNWERHGLPSFPRKWTLDDRPKEDRARDDDLVAQRICKGCTQPYPAYLKPCPYCGTPHLTEDGGRFIESVDGEIAELDEDAFAELFARVKSANMSAEEFELDMIARNVPPVGRGKQARAHEAAKYRRGVLRNLVGWWIGYQPHGRTMGEKHRRFYHRFGVDIAEAFTLSADDTDALIETIKRKFTKDLKEDEL